MVLKVLERALRANVPLLLVGPTGEGKSAISRQLADFFVLLDVPAAPEELLAPLPVVDGGHVRLVPPDWYYQVNDAASQGQLAVVILEEIMSAPERKVAGALNLLGNRMVGTYALHEEVRIIATANPVGEAVAAQELAPPARARFMWVRWSLPMDLWEAYLRSKYCGGEQVLCDLREGVRKPIPEDMLLRGADAIIQFRTAHANFFTEEARAEQHEAVPCSRMLEYTIRYLAAAWDDGGDITVGELIGLLGYEAGPSLHQFINCELLTVDAMLAHPEKLADANQMQVASLACETARYGEQAVEDEAAKQKLYQLYLVWEKSEGLTRERLATMIGAGLRRYITKSHSKGTLRMEDWMTKFSLEDLADE